MSQNLNKHSSVTANLRTPIEKDKKEFAQALQILFYSYSIKLNSFLDLYETPFTKKLLDETSFQNSPILRIGVLGNEKSGKTILINELSRQFSQNTNCTITFNGTSSEAIYYKSVTNPFTKISILFMKAPSLNHPLKESRKYTFAQLLFDRSIMKKFVIGYFAWYCDILIIVVDWNSEKDFEKYYNEIKTMRHSTDILYIVHNIEKDTEERKKELMTELENETKYYKNNFNTMTLKLSTNIIEYYYVNKQDPSIIHLIYKPKSNDKLKAIDEDNKIFIKDNTLIMNFLVSSIQVKTQKGKGRTVKESFDKYLEAFASQLYKDSPIHCIQSTESDNRLMQKYESKHLTESLVNIDVIPQNNSPNSSYCIKERKDKKLALVSLFVPTYAQVEPLNETIGDMNVLKYNIKVETKLTQCDDKYASSFCFDNLPKNVCFERRIPNNECIIMKVLPTKMLIDRTIVLAYEVLEEGKEEILDFI